ncbi:MAG TPA: hypothetical protein VFH39_00835 [Candidatus Saccharimonadales bacterium]|nr:hypothetical protein [Candidatus Saccharimonadales bacterium]
MRHFDTWFGAHQKIDRTARKHLDAVLPDSGFPKVRLITRFEGQDGPDGIKRKNPAKDEPWHYIDPFDANDDQILGVIGSHYEQLVTALREHDEVRAAFEAAWLSHAIVDGLTPAHHYPYEAELIKLRGGKGIESRTTPKEKLILPGDTLPKQLNNNWKMWGDKGLLSTHFAFEWGVAAIIAPLRLRRSLPTAEQMNQARRLGAAKLFHKRARQIAELRMYDQFYRSGWTPRLARQVRRELAPTIINTVTLAWYVAAMEASRKGNV